MLSVTEFNVTDTPEGLPGAGWLGYIRRDVNTCALNLAAAGGGVESGVFADHNGLCRAQKQVDR